jgi:cob(I)alamin adenosyltransferase
MNNIIPHSKIYTKKGDKGMTSLYNGRREKKNSCVFMGCGEVDELNSSIGLAIEYCKRDKIPQEILNILYEIQVYLFDVGAVIATPITSSSKSHLERVKFDVNIISKIEKYIDTYDAKLKPLQHFILPSGGLVGAQLHICRTICRKAERLLIVLLDSGNLPSCIIQFMNRLSDLLFVLARYTAMIRGHEERIYSKIYV